MSKAKKKRAKHEYVVGYLGERDCVYGSVRDPHVVRYAERMTLGQAKRYLRRELASPGMWAGVFKLVPVLTERVPEPKGIRTGGKHS